MGWVPTPVQMQHVSEPVCRAKLLHGTAWLKGLAPLALLPWRTGNQNIPWRREPRPFLGKYFPAWSLLLSSEAAIALAPCLSWLVGSALAQQKASPTGICEKLVMFVWCVAESITAGHTLWMHQALIMLMSCELLLPRHLWGPVIRYVPKNCWVSSKAQWAPILLEGHIHT